MNLSLVQVKAEINRLCKENNIMTVATHGIRAWNIKSSYSGDMGELFCIIKDKQTIQNIRKNPRVAFSINLPSLESRVQGNGIAVISENGGVKIRPYRFSLTGIEADAEKEVIIEKRRLEWVLAEDIPETGGYGSKGFKAWLSFWSKASRSVSFPLAVFPVVIGGASALVKGSFDVMLFILSLLGGVLILAGVNLFSDYNDFKKGIDTTDALSSHTGLLVNETVAPERFLKAAFLCFMITTLIGGFLIGEVGWPVLLIGVAGIAGGYSYTSGPLAYKYVGLAEGIISLLMGPIMVLGAYYVQMKRIDLFPLLVSIPVGLLVGSVTLANNLRDMLDDRKANITTLPMRIGIRRAKITYYFMILVPYLLIVLMVLAKPALYPLLLVLLSIPSAVKALKAFGSTEDSAEDIKAKAGQLKYPLNSIKLHFRFCLSLLAGCLLLALLHYII